MKRSMAEASVRRVDRTWYTPRSSKLVTLLGAAGGLLEPQRELRFLE